MDPSQPHFPGNKKQNKKGDSNADVFLLFLQNFSEHLFLRTIMVAASKDEHDETKLLQTSRLNRCYL